MIYNVLVLVLGSSFVVGPQDMQFKDIMEPTLRRKPRLFNASSSPTNITQAPFVVALVAFDKCWMDPSPCIMEPEAICAGSIITRVWVITVAHCLGRLIPSSIFQVVAGCNSRRKFDTLGGMWPGQAWNCSGNSDAAKQVRNVSDWLIHPQYEWNPQNPNQFDASLVKVRSPFNFTVAVSAISFWDKAWKGTPTTCTAYGWGAIFMDAHGVTESNKLRRADFVVQLGSCSCLKDNFSRDLFCTDRGRVESNLCIGDGGGPLVCENRLVGLGQKIFECQDGRLVHVEPEYCGPKVYSAWVYVCPLLNWIKSIVPDAPKKPPKCSGRSSLKSSFLLAVFPVMTLSSPTHL